MPLDHFSLSVPQSKLEAMVAFLTSALQHLGFKEHMRPIASVVGMGDAVAFLWIDGLGPEVGDETTQERVLKRQHVAFSAESQSSMRGVPSSSPLVFLFPRCIFLISIPARPLTDMHHRR